MKNLLFIISLSAIFSMVVNLSAIPQDTTTSLIRITLNDGSELVGTILTQNDTTIHFKMQSGIEMHIPSEQIRSIKELKGRMVDGNYYRPDPNHTRLFFSPTARALKHGQGYFAIYQIFFPFVAVGIGDIISLGGGFSLIPGVDSQLLYLAPKITIVHANQFDLAGGVLYISAHGFGGDGLGIVYGVGTFGTQDAAVTAGLGWGFAGEDFANQPIFMIGGELRTANYIKLISENWFPPDVDGALLSFGIRLFGENMAGDFSLIFPAGSGIQGFPFIPWVGFAYNFGH